MDSRAAEAISAITVELSLFDTRRLELPRNRAGGWTDMATRRGWAELAFLVAEALQSLMSDVNVRGWMGVPTRETRLVNALL